MFECLALRKAAHSLALSLDVLGKLLVRLVISTAILGELRILKRFYKNGVKNSLQNSLLNTAKFTMYSSPDFYFLWLTSFAI